MSTNLNAGASVGAKAQPQAGAKETFNEAKDFVKGAASKLEAKLNPESNLPLGANTL
jgi:hypothetical protein